MASKLCINQTNPRIIIEVERIFKKNSKKSKKGVDKGRGMWYYNQAPLRAAKK